MSELKAATPSARLIELIRAKGVNIRAGAVINRTYAGRHQKAAGAGVWIIAPGDADTALYQKSVSSIWTVSELLKAPDIAVTSNRYGDIDVAPADM